MADIRTNLRIPEELYEEIRQLADKEMRSINAQMVVLLADAVRRRKRRAQIDENNEEIRRPVPAAA